MYEILGVKHVFSTVSKELYGATLIMHFTRIIQSCMNLTNLQVHNYIWQILYRAIKQ